MLVVALLPCASAPADDATRWGVERSAEDGVGEQHPIAIVLSPDGDELRVHRSKDDRIGLSLRLRKGFERFDSGACPTVQIDADNAVAAASESGACEVADRVATMPLGRIAEDVIRSSVLARLMEGTRLVWRVRLDGLGYREITFTLRGSMQALVDVMGTATRVER